MSDLAEFLLARIAEDEAVARANTDHAEHSRWDMWSVERANDRAFLVRQAPPAGRKSRRLEVHHHDIYLLDQLARWDPDRVLAECEAKRRIVRWAGRWPMRPPNASDGIAAEDTLLRLLAQPYAGHPDCREEWRP